MVHYGMITSMAIKKYIYFFLVLALCFVSCKPKPEPPEPEKKVLAFPGAQGGGAYTTGGRGGVVVHVTTLEDTKDPSTGQPSFGTLRKAVQMDGTRTIVFDVSGTIYLKSQLEIASGNVTIAGQTAPGDGICIAGYPVVVKASNVIMRFLRFRMGDTNKVEGDALSINDKKNILIDHCSFSWSTDECVSCYGNTDFTLQYCIISESLNNSVHAKGAHGYAGIWGGENTTFHHNLLAHHSSRMPRFDHDYVTEDNIGPTDFINNVVYNWGSNSAYGGESRTSSGNQRQYNFIANYYKPGPATKSGVKDRLLNPTTKCSNCGSSVTPGKFYIVNNTMYGSSTVTADNWSGVYPDESSKKAQCRSDKRFKLDTPYANEQTAQEAYETVLAKVGCSLKRDAIDMRIVNEVKNGSYTYTGSNGSTGGLIDTPSDVGGWPTYSGTRTEVEDADKDGILDAWETEHGLNPADPADAKLTTLQSPYLNLEVYMNELVQHLY